jgi:hypothetical protein
LKLIGELLCRSRRKSGRKAAGRAGEEGVSLSGRHGKQHWERQAPGWRQAKRHSGEWRSRAEEEGVWEAFVLGGGFMSDMNVRPPKVEEGSLALVGMTAGGRGKRNPRTGLKTGHYIRQGTARLLPTAGKRSG